MKTVLIELSITARGRPPRREYRSEMVRQLEHSQEEEGPSDYDPPASLVVEVQDVPAALSPWDVHLAAMTLFERGFPMPSPIDWQSLASGLKARGFELVPGRSIREVRK